MNKKIIEGLVIASTLPLALGIIHDGVLAFAHLYDADYNPTMMGFGGGLLVSTGMGVITGVSVLLWGKK